MIQPLKIMTPKEKIKRTFEFALLQSNHARTIQDLTRDR
jgi:hypothetical protein